MGGGEGTIDKFLSQFLVNSESKVVADEAVGVVAGGQVDVAPVLASLDDVRVDVEVGEERKHDKHVWCKQVLAPARELTLNVQAVHGVRQGDEKLNLDSR